MPKMLLKGNDAVVRGAILAGCRLYFGYPITPASEIAETAAKFFPLVGGSFLQAESEVAAINMVYGAAAAGVRAMTASSGPGISLKQEGISYLAGSELPCVIVDIMRGGPGLGNIAPEQGDYNQVVKGGGHGNYKTIVVAPASVQEMCDFAFLAFELADRYRNPVCILTDGFIGQMMEPVEFPEPIKEIPKKPWSVDPQYKIRENLISSIYLSNVELEAHINHLQDKYREVEKNEIRYETYKTEDADLILIAYGIVSRLAKTAIDQARAEGMKVGLLRPITLWPFPSQAIRDVAGRAQAILVSEMSVGQMVDDVRLAIEGRVPIEFYGRYGGSVPSAAELYDKICALIRKDQAAAVRS
ncbi:MAG: 3-methyl-2-oxobutanoate dehydrogenase subunit VorB [Candidatus Eisenbacteria bacterium]|uniref:3-methyl-2-oxobutanoate dehydrogenase subunit VorB n=1 Tax=Eiseniibacteriota bacterium TaxID=2212470 RepID=A0A948RYT0_UNCEI|nr:3-methyl-2-oxobutanoate dehydrogenase subunit VorB [Candidatus Eisenbacteria bacterium]MBU1947243.1 3-methyl-2-oxobutanoate dehydrogenase subunit VorB [Candidatus Eisenbacteria bacterium]MBU2690724.1 3-methyl-2-oxobutanoate dehydrogenase subunit VorB [Candidatus Eisenbacteria bacterium]